MAGTPCQPDPGMPPLSLVGAPLSTVRAYVPQHPLTLWLPSSGTCSSQWGAQPGSTQAATSAHVLAVRVRPLRLPVCACMPHCGRTQVSGLRQMNILPATYGAYSSCSTEGERETARVTDVEGCNGTGHDRQALACTQGHRTAAPSTPAPRPSAASICGWGRYRQYSRGSTRLYCSSEVIQLFRTSDLGAELVRIQGTRMVSSPSQHESENETPTEDCPVDQQHHDFPSSTDASPRMQVTSTRPSKSRC